MRFGPVTTLLHRDGFLFSSLRGTRVTSCHCEERGDPLVIARNEGTPCHCEEQSDEAISVSPWMEIASSLRSSQ
jgi:hypothetical protein